MACPYCMNGECIGKHRTTGTRHHIKAVGVVGRCRELSKDVFGAAAAFIFQLLCGKSGSRQVPNESSGTSGWQFASAIPEAHR